MEHKQSPKTMQGLFGASPNSMALLSPPSSRYAFEPALTTAAIPPIGSLHDSASSGQAAPLQSPSGFATYGKENDVPAFEPQTELELQNFTADLGTFSLWVGSMKPEQQKTVMDVLLDTVDDSVVDYVHDKAKNALLEEGVKFSPPMSAATSGLPQRPVSPLVMLGGDGGLGGDSSPVFAPQTLSPQMASPQPVTQPLMHPFAQQQTFDPVGSRPRSAGYGAYYQQLQGLQGGQLQQGFPQAAPMLRVFSSDLDPNGYQRRQRDFFDDDVSQQFGLSATTTDFAGRDAAMKLNNSLARRKKTSGTTSPAAEPSPTSTTATTAPVTGGGQAPAKAPMTAAAAIKAAVRAANSKESPPKTTAAALRKPPAAASPTSPAAVSMANSGSESGTAPSVVKSASAQDIASQELLQNIPQWLKTLRLHKYTDNLKSLSWEEMIELDDDQLQDLGVTTVGARNKLLKSFVFVKENLHR